MNTDEPEQSDGAEPSTDPAQGSGQAATVDSEAEGPPAPKVSNDGGRRQKPRKARGRAKKTAKKGRRAARKANSASTASAKYPRHSVEKALRIPTAIYEQNGGQPATSQQAVEFSGGAAISGPWRVEISSAKKYGFLEAKAANQLALTDRARQAIAPQSPTDRINALREAVLAAPIFRTSTTTTAGRTCLINSSSTMH